MNKTLVRRRATKGAITAVLVGVGTASMAALDTAITDGVAAAVADILLVVALGGAAFVTISSSGVVWGVASKFIKRLQGKV